MSKKLIVLTGAPGSGKGYLCDLLISNLQEKLQCEIAVISTGDLIRHEIKNETSLGATIKNIIEAGELVSDEIVAALVKQHLFELPAPIVIFDGYPRTINQTVDFCEIVQDMPVVLIHRETPTDLILERVAKRRICQKCGKVQSSDNADCCVCHGPLGIRKDDAVIEKRLKVYKEETVPAIEVMTDIYPWNFNLDGTEEAEVSIKAILNDLLEMLT